MPIATALQNQISAIQSRIDAVAATATPEDVVMLAKAVEAIGGQATVFDVIETGNQKKSEITDLAATKSGEITSLTNSKKAEVVAAGDAKKAELNAALQQHAAYGGATASAPGTLGMVPAPTAGQHDAYLRGDGSWAKTGEIPIGGIALIHPNMDTSRYLPANGGTVLIADYPLLADVLGQEPANFYQWSNGGNSVLNESLGYSATYRSATVNGNRAAVLRSGSSGIQYSADGGQNWSNAGVGSMQNSSPMFPVMSDTGRTIGWVAYDSTNSRQPLYAVSASAFGAWASNFNGDAGNYFYLSWNPVMIGMASGIAALDNSAANSNHVVFKYVQDGASGNTREVNLTTGFDARITKVRGAFRNGANLFVLVDNNSNWNAILKTSDNGASWTIAWEGTATWGGSHNAMNYGANTRQDAGQASYVENGVAIIHYGSKLLLVAANGTVTSVDQPAGHTLVAGSIHYVGGFYYAISATAVFKSADLATWEQVATNAQIAGGSGNNLSQLYVHAASGSFVFRMAQNTLPFVHTKDFVNYRRTAAPSRWKANASHVYRRCAYTGDRHLVITVESYNNSYNYDYGLYDLASGRLYCGNYFQNQSNSITPGWLLPLPNGRWLHYTVISSNYNCAVSGLSTYYTYNLSTEFKLPTSNGDFIVVAAYGSQASWLYDTSTSSRGGYGYYIRAK